jgi:iron complex transport system ATP-binding protein
MVAGKIQSIGTPVEVLQSKVISEAYCLPVQVVKHPLTGDPLVLPESPLPKGEG